MTRLTLLATTVAAVMVASVLVAAQPLTLDEAVAIGLRANLDVRAATATVSETKARQDVAHASWFPRVGLQESWQRGDQPVYVFGSLLAQRRFTAADFAIPSLNNPESISNYRAAVGVRQPIFDVLDTSARTQAASAAAAVAAADRQVAAADVAVAIARAFGQVLAADAASRAAEAAVTAATSAKGRAAARREAGTVTQADLLAFDVHLAQMQSRRVQAVSDATVARATLNRLLDRPLDAPLDLADVTAAVAASPSQDRGTPATAAEVTAATTRVATSEVEMRTAGAAWYPVVAAEGGYEWNGNVWNDRAGAWLVGVSARWNFSTGGAESAGTRAARAAHDRAVAQQASAASSAQLAIVTANAALSAARARAAIGDTAVIQARESQRIIRDRYDAGLATVTDVLAAAQAVLEAEALRGSSHADLAVAVVALRRAQGTLP